MLSPVKRNTFRKPEKICNQKQIDNLFKDGKSLKSGLFRVLYLESESQGASPVEPTPRSNP
jgi:RNase P protein component